MSTETTSLYSWFPAEGVAIAALEEGKLLEVSAGPKRVGMLKRQDKVLAFASKCPHASANLCEGWLDGMGRIVCPLHKYRFDPANGRNTSGEGYKLVTYPVEIRGDEIFVGFLTTSL